MATEPPTTTAQALHAALHRPVDPASLVLFRVSFGLLNLLSILRFAAKGWIEEIYIRPTFHFSYWGFEWITPWQGQGMYGHFVILGLAALWLTVGFFYRLSALVFFLAFTSLELMEKATYLNHYYFISVVSFLMIFLPLGEVGSWDAWRSKREPRRTLPAWMLWTLRIQLGLVYFFAGLAKLKPDWLLEAQPLRTWLLARSEFPLLGPLFTQSWVAYLMSWTGMLFDLTVFFFLITPRTRRMAYVAVLAFHLLTGLLFHIGMFPWIMIGLTLLFFEPSWPRHLPLLGTLCAKLLPMPTTADAPTPAEQPAQTSLLRGWGAWALSLHFLIQLLLPLRHHLYPGPVTWNEEGMRFAWHVMLIEKSGAVEYRVEESSTGKHWRVNPREYLTDLQTKAMATQPDMILSFAHWLAELYRLRGHPQVRIYASTRVALNGRSGQPLIDPTVDLVQERDGLAPKAWILPLRDP